MVATTGGGRLINVTSKMRSFPLLLTVWSATFARADNFAVIAVGSAGWYKCVCLALTPPTSPPVFFSCVPARRHLAHLPALACTTPHRPILAFSPSDDVR